MHLYIVVSLENVSSHPDNYALAYLLWAHSDNVGQFLYDKIDAFYAWFFYSTYLLFHYSLKGHIRREETDSDTWRANVIQNFSYSNNILCFPWCYSTFHQQILLHIMIKYNSSLICQYALFYIIRDFKANSIKNINPIYLICLQDLLYIIYNLIFGGLYQ